MNKQMIVVVISAGTEWRAIRERFPRLRVRRSPFGKWGEARLPGEPHGSSVVLFHGGVGKVNAAASTQYVIDRYSPDLLINIGTCGGIEGEVSPGDVLLVEKTIIYDIYERMGDPDEAIAKYTTTLELDWIEETPPDVRRSLMVSGDGDLDPAMIPTLRDKYNAIAADWESGAIAHVCRLNGVHCLILRGVSDLANEVEAEAHQNPEVYRSRAPEIMNNLVDSLPRWIDVHNHGTPHDNCVQRTDAVDA